MVGCITAGFVLIRLFHDIVQRSIKASPELVFSIDAAKFMHAKHVVARKVIGDLRAVIDCGFGGSRAAA
jgi:hypothetical protein